MSHLECGKVSPYIRNNFFDIFVCFVIFSILCLYILFIVSIFPYVCRYILLFFHPFVDIFRSFLHSFNSSVDTICIIRLVFRFVPVCPQMNRGIFIFCSYILFIFSIFPIRFLYILFFFHPFVSSFVRLDTVWSSVPFVVSFQFARRWIVASTRCSAWTTSAR